MDQGSGSNIKNADTNVAGPETINTAIDAITNESLRMRLRQVFAVPLAELSKGGCAGSGDLASMLKPALAIGRANNEVAQILDAFATLATAAGHSGAAAFGVAVAAMRQPREANASTARPIVKPTPISGFLEFNPEYQLCLDDTLTQIRDIFSAHGFVPIDTPVVEKMEVLAAKGGDVDKEIYSLVRAQAADADNSDANLVLRYDLTVPFARYVARHFNDITFPFKRFHIGDCWRGERPQDGRYRQFKQADIDVVNTDNLPISFDADIPLIVNEAIQKMGVKDYVFRISNRKILSGYLAGLGIENIQLTTRSLDKLDKIGHAAVVSLLTEQAGLSTEQAERALKLAAIKTPDTSFIDKVGALGVTHPLLEQGLADLAYVMQRVGAAKSAAFLADLSITRGFDYYTGSVYEVRWNQHPGIGSIAAGGRYDDLASSFTRQKLPGVGMSIGISRIYGKLVQTNAVKFARRTSTDALIVWDPSEPEAPLQEIARTLRAQGVNVEVYYAPEHLNKQLRYADRKGIKYVVFPRFGEVRDMTSGSQTPFHPDFFNDKSALPRTKAL